MRPQPAYLRLPFLAITLISGTMTSCGEPPKLYSPPDSGLPKGPPAVKIIQPVDGTKFHAHDDIHLVALATPHGSTLDPDPAQSKAFADASKWDLRTGDEMAVTFVAGTNNLGSLSSGLTTAKVHSRPGQATPMFVALVGYPEVDFTWTNVPAGSYALTACVTNSDGLGTVSAAVNITVLP